MDSMSDVLLSGITTESVISLEVSEAPRFGSRNTPGLAVSCTVSPGLQAHNRNKDNAAIIFIRNIVSQGYCNFSAMPN
ncbi:MAG TPA: hypothetical protein VM843_07695 [Flavisolibacter sp.]|nr:hypothetical protein [Flavisolibacter sp.]